MTKVLFVLVGLILIGLGVWGAIAWSDAVLAFLEAIVVVLALFAGLVMVIFTLSELRAPEPPAGAPPAPAEPKDAA